MFVAQSLFDMRFRFEYSDGKPTMLGKWNDTNKHAKKQAWSVNRTGLSRVMIEARNIETGEIKVVVDCPGHDYRFMQWRAVRSFNLNALSNQTLTRNIGLVLWTSSKKIYVYNWGKVEIEELSIDDKKYHFAAYGR
jgi:hypothetical protein